MRFAPRAPRVSMRRSLGACSCHVNGYAAGLGTTVDAGWSADPGPRDLPGQCCYPPCVDLLAEIPLDPVLTKRLIWNVLPAAAVVLAMYVVVAGKSGLLARYSLKERVRSTQQAVAAVKESNDHKRARIAALKRDPDALRRAAADELFVAPPGATVYRFADE